MKYIVWGATTSAEDIYMAIEQFAEIEALTDNDATKWGKKLGGYDIISPNELETREFDKVAIASLSAMNAIRLQLLEMGVPATKIDTSWVETQVKARINFVSDFAKIAEKYLLEGCVAEAGVFQGEFAKEINRVFPNRKLYLFDTFEGFDKRDVEIETEKNYSEAKVGHLNITSEQLVMEKMIYPQNCIIKKGYFPESAHGIEEEFCFVNLDMDLYKPTMEGLKFFWDKMVDGGIIVIHDYYSNGYKGVTDAVDQFATEKHIVLNDPPKMVHRSTKLYPLPANQRALLL